MKPGQLADVLAEIVLKTTITPLVWGSRGIGKSRIVASLTRRLQEVTGEPWGLVDLRISTQEISDLTGLPRPVSWRATNLHTGEEDQVTETDWSVPVWFPIVEKINQKGRKIPENGIIFLDEINRGGHQETQAIFQFVLDRRIHTHILAPGWKIVAAANPPTEDYLVNEFDAALLDRFIHLNLKPDAGDWLNWAYSEEGHISETITRFIGTYPEMLCEISEEEQNWTPGIKSSPRSWEAVDIILKNCRISADIETEVLAGLIGNIPALSFREFISKEYTRPVKAEEIMLDYPGIRSSIQEIVAKNRLDILNMTLQDLVVLAKSSPDRFNMENFFGFLMDLPNDLKVTLVHTLLENEQIYKLMNGHEGLLAEIGRIMNEVERKNGEEAVHS